MKPQPLLFCRPRLSLPILAITALLPCLSTLSAQRIPPQQFPGRSSDAHQGYLIQLRSDGPDLEPLARAIRQSEPVAQRKVLLDKIQNQSRALQAGKIREIEDLGAHLVRSWWLVNAVLVHASPDVAARIARLPSVARVEPDRLHRPMGDSFLDVFNHNVAAVHKLGFHGEGLQKPVVFAILDSGLDLTALARHRPHRTFYIDGDPKNLKGGGIQNSRILRVAKLGKLGIEDVNGHGTAIAALAAGADWGARHSTVGHADRAKIASYTIGDSINDGKILALSSTIVTAWQTLLGDKNKGLQIVVANHSYGGSQDPLSIPQQALDRCARIGDILITVAAGNDGAQGPRSGGQSAANGLSVGACTQDELKISAWSSRGPVKGDDKRGYPDLTALTDSLVPLPDCEQGYGLMRGTSCSSAHVAGAALILRAANPLLRVDEIKAILLASARELASTNPTLDRNAYGMGLLRDDLALRTLLDASAHRRGSVSASNKIWTHQFAAKAGQSYGVALAWLRQNTKTKDWSNLDVEIRKGTLAVAFGLAPRDLYEKVEFTASTTGTYTVRVEAKSLEKGSTQQGFALAISKLPTRFPQAATWSVYGASCAGSIKGRGDIAEVWNPGAVGKPFQEQIHGNRPHAMRMTMDQQVQLRGLEVYVEGKDSQTLKISIRNDNGGLPGGSILAQGSIPVERGASWRGLRLAKTLTLQKGKSYHLVLEPGARLGAGVLPDDPKEKAPTWHVLDTCTKNWESWSEHPFLALRLLASTQVRKAHPRIALGGLPILGQRHFVYVDDVKPSSPLILLTGTSKFSWGPIPLPFDLKPLGSPGCKILLAPDLYSFASSDAAGEGQAAFPLPNDKEFAGATFFQQWLVLDPAANAGSLVLSKALELRIQDF